MSGSYELKKDLAAVSLTALCISACGSMLRYLLALSGVWPADVYSLLEIASYLLMLFFPVAGMMLLMNVRPSEVFRFSAPPAGLTVAGTAMTLGVAFAANMLSNALCGLLERRGAALPEYSPDFSGGVLSFLLALLSSVLLPAVAEELVYRGFLLGVLRRWGDGFAIAVSAVLFALGHSGVAQLIPALAVGLCLGWLAAASGSLLLPMAAHLLNNIFAMAATLASSSEQAVAVITAVAWGFVAMAAVAAAVLLIRGRGIPGLHASELSRGQLCRAALTNFYFMATVLWLMWRTLSAVSFA